MKTLLIVETIGVGLALAAAIAAQPTLAGEHRSHKAVADFKRAHVCPSTGLARAGRCPGYVVDHVTPLCAGGADAPWNMQYQAIAAARAKDREEWALCRELRRGRL